jgi:endonuclease/exonuclease/phosphatase family metal-dependent hydrolase
MYPDSVIWMGDFNYRIGLGSEKVKQLIKAGDLERMYENDQV